jgi:hypothetical protein
VLRFLASQFVWVALIPIPVAIDSALALTDGMRLRQYSFFVWHHALRSGRNENNDGNNVMAYWMVGLELAVMLIIGLAIYLATRK